jgi:hypothetical protein
MDLKFEKLMLEQIKMLMCHLGKGVGNVHYSFLLNVLSLILTASTSFRCIYSHHNDLGQPGPVLHAWGRIMCQLINDHSFENVIMFHKSEQKSSSPDVIYTEHMILPFSKSYMACSVQYNSLA